MTIDLVKVRAEVIIGDISTIRVETPFVQSFNVRKARNQASTFDASLKVRHNEISQTQVSGPVIINAGANGTLNPIFTGVIKKATVSPCWDDPGYVILNISGADILTNLQGKKYTRRCRATKSTWVSINSVVREGLRDGRFDYKFNTLKTTPGTSTNVQEVIGQGVSMIDNTTYKPSKAEAEKTVEVKITLQPSNTQPDVPSSEE